MRPGLLSSRQFRLALGLAFFAVFAQLALALASSEHHARMLTSNAGDWEEICTPAGVERIALFDHPADPRNGEQPPGLPLLGDCVLCVAASLSALPGALSALSAPELPTVAIAWPTSIPSTAAVPALRPPVRAPPIFS